MVKRARKDMAHKTSTRFGDNGINFYDSRSITLDAACRAEGANVTRGRRKDDEFIRYEFDDGSVIIHCTNRDLWDIGYRSCFCWEELGHTDECEKKARAALEGKEKP